MPALAQSGLHPDNPFVFCEMNFLLIIVGLCVSNPPDIWKWCILIEEMEANNATSVVVDVHTRDPVQDVIWNHVGILCLIAIILLDRLFPIA